VDGCLLTCQGEETCGTCKEHGPIAYHGARYRVPFSPDFPYFKVSLKRCLNSDSATGYSNFLVEHVK